MRQILARFLLLALVTLPFASANAQDSDMESQLRDALRSATTQLRELQDAQVAEQAKDAELEKQNDALRQQVAALTQQGGTSSAAAGNAAPQQDHAALQQAVAEFNRKLAAQNQAISQMNDTLDKWKSAYNEAATVARAKEAERAQLATKLDGLTKTATSCAAKNDALFKVGNEILDRYQHMDFGDALGAREPFIGFERVKLQKLVQDYHDKLLDQKVQDSATP